MWIFKSKCKEWQSRGYPKFLKTRLKQWVPYVVNIVYLTCDNLPFFSPFSQRFPPGYSHALSDFGVYTR